MRPSRCWPLVVVVVLVGVWTMATAVPGASQISPSDVPARTWRPYLGIALIERVLTAPRPARIHIAQVDLRAPGLRVTVTPPAGAREVVRETTLQFLTRTGAQLAVNAHFFLPFPSEDAEAWVIGLAASEGRVYSISLRIVSPNDARPVAGS